MRKKVTNINNFLLAKQKEDQERGLMALADLQKKETENIEGSILT